MRVRKGAWLVSLIALALAYAALSYWLTTASGLEALGALAPYVPWFYFAEHIVMFVALATWFGASLRPGRQALVTRFALVMEEKLSPAAVTYTRQVTLAWTVFFAVIATLSALLYFRAPLELWSLFANLLSLPLVGAMFLAEGWLRVRKCPELARGGVLRGVLRSVRAYWESSAGTTAGPR